MLLELNDTLGDAVRDAVRVTVADAALADVDHAVMHDALLEAIRRKDPEAARRETARYLDLYSAVLKRGAR